ncbi:HdeD family acid-resistance protein [Streptomyces sp. NPDC054796]
MSQFAPPGGGQRRPESPGSSESRQPGRSHADPPYSRGARETRETGGDAVGGLPDSPLVRMAAGKSAHALVVAGIVACALGVLALVWPGVTVVVAGVVFGAYLVVSGVVQVVSAFGTRLTTATRVIGVVSGAVSVLAGLFCFRGELQSVLLLALWIGVSWVLRGITQLAGAAGDAQAPARGWQMFLGAVSVLGGVVLIVAPFPSVTALTVVTGVWLLALGIVELVTGLRLWLHLRQR